MKRKKLLLIAVVGLLLSQVQAQTWEKYADFPINLNPVDVDVNNAGTFFMLTSDKRIFYKLQNQNWAVMPNYGVQNFLNIRCKKNSNRLYIADEFQGLIATSDFGQTYETLYLTTNPVTGFHEPVIALSNTNTNGVFFGASVNGFSPTIIKYTNDGNSGQIISFDPTDNPNNIIDEMIYTTSNTLLMGTDNGGIWLSTNDGQTFQQSNFNQNNVFSFTEGANGVVYALGFNFTQNQSFLIKSSDYLNWTTLSLPDPSLQYKTVFIENGTNNLWLASETDLYKTTVSGSTTAPWNLANYDNGFQSCIELFNYNGIVYNFTKEYIAQSLNAGNEWSTPLTQGLDGISNRAGFGQNNKLFSTSFTTGTVSTLNNSTDFWNNKVLSNFLSFDLITKANGKIYASFGKQLLKSEDNGMSYADITPPNTGNSYIYRFFVGENNSLFAVINNDNQKIYRSVDDGASWALFGDFTATDPFDPATIESIAEDNTGRVFVTVTSFNVFNGFNNIYYSTDQGGTWNFLTYNAEDHQDDCNSAINEVRSVGANTFCAPCSKTYKLNLNNAVDPFGNEITFNGNSITPKSLKINAAGDYYINYNGIHKSINQGQTWSNLVAPVELTNVDTQVSDLFFDNDYNLFLVTGDGSNVPVGIRGFYKLTEQLSTNSYTSNHFEVFPNPATSYININSQLPLKTATMFDMSGKKIKTATTNIFNISDVAQGIYLLNIEDVAGNRETQKIIKNN